MTAIEEFQHPADRQSGEPALSQISQMPQTPVSGFVARTEQPSPRPTGRKIVGFLLLSVVLAGICAQLGFFGFQLFDEEWRARAEVQYRGTAWTETQNVAVQSRSITEPVAQEFSVPIKEFEEHLDAGLIAGTQIVQIDYVSADRNVARGVVEAISQAYIDEVSEGQPAELRATLQAELAELQQRLEDAENRLRMLARDTSDAAKVQQQATQSLISSLRARVDDFELRILDGDLRALDDQENAVPFLVTEPYVFDDPVFPRPKLMGVVGGAGGLVLGLVALALYWNVIAWRHETYREQAVARR